MPKTKTKGPMAEAMIAYGGMPVNCSLGFFQLEKNGELRTAWQMHHHFTGEVLSDEKTSDAAMREGCKAYERRQNP